jgi:hypothetical protein
MKSLIISMFHFFPGVPRVKMERFAGLVTYFQGLFSRANGG